MRSKTKMGFFFPLVLLFCFGIMNPAYARDLVKVGTSNDSDGESTFYADRDGFRRVGRFVWFWGEAFTHDFSGRLIFQARSYYSADCENNNLRAREVFLFRRNGEIVNSHRKLGDSGPVISPQSGSPLESAIKYVCQNF